jgi:hypothetical protein
MSSNAPPPLPAPGWYPDPSGVGQRWWDGQAWGPSSPPPLPAAAVPVVQSQVGQAVVVYPRAEKSSGLALLFTILWPGAGSLYLGLTRKGTPFVVANAIGFVLGVLTLLFLPVTLIIWVVTLAMTVGSINQDTETVNRAIREGRRITEV